MHVKFFPLAFIFSLFLDFCYAQKLPDVQQNSVVAPSNVKADGKNLEWKDTFQALNKRTNLQYTLANDEENLYLVIKSSDAATNNKIIAGGIDFSVNTDGKRREKEGYRITYPLIHRTSSKSNKGSGKTQGFQRGQQTQQQRDSIMLALRKVQLLQVKEIKIHGFRAIPDTLVSIYNEYRLKAFASFDQKGAFFYELAVPLKLMGLSAQTSGEIAYNIKLNGIQMNFGGGGGDKKIKLSPGGSGGGGGGFGGGSTDMQDLLSATDFWGSYKLAK